MTCAALNIKIIYLTRFFWILFPLISRVKKTRIWEDFEPCCAANNYLYSFTHENSDGLDLCGLSEYHVVRCLYPVRNEFCEKRTGLLHSLV